MDVFTLGPFNLLERWMVSVKVDKRITKLCRQYVRIVYVNKTSMTW